MVVVGRNNLTVFEPTSIGSVTYIHTYFIGSGLFRVNQAFW